jgi:hypothetical protein
MRQCETVDRWMLLRLLGRGGSGEVWAAHDDAGKQVALKIQHSYPARFRDEVKIYRQLGNRPGILPLVDAYLPDSSGKKSRDVAWIAMEIGIPITDYLGPNPALRAVVDGMISYSGTLAGLSKENIFHRDIKPSNLYWAKEEFAIGDFGIADFPDKAGLTVPGRRIGPANYLAPEMIDYSGEVRSGPADVYSLAKTLWAVAAGHKNPPPGELRRDRHDLRLSSVVEDPRAPMLEPLLERATAHDPAGRPTMDEMLDELTWWNTPEVKPVPLPRLNSDGSVDLSVYAQEVERIRAATAAPIGPLREASEQQRLERFYNDALSRVRDDLMKPVEAAIKSTGLTTAASIPMESNIGWYPNEYGGSATHPCWTIESLSAPLLASAFGVAHRAEPWPDLEDLLVFVRIVELAPGSERTHLDLIKKFSPDSMRLDHLIGDLRNEIERKLGEIIAGFLSRCKANGVPR